jgi:hemin uptake protein HemP
MDDDPEVTPNQPPQTNAGAQPSASPTSPRSVRSIDLLQGGREVLIQHNEDTYRLRLTRNGKLILVK